MRPRLPQPVGAALLGAAVLWLLLFALAFLMNCDAEGATGLLDPHLLPPGIQFHDSRWTRSIAQQRYV